MRGTIGVYEKPDGRQEVRMYFPSWPLPDGREVNNVSVHPHRCGTCVGGDHTHVEINDTRPSLKVIDDTVFFAPEHVLAISRLLAEKLAVDALTGELAQYVEPPLR